MTTETSKNAPLETLKDGAVSIKLWEQKTEDKSYVNASIGKLYKDGEGQWRETRSFNATDLLKLQAMLPQAHEAMQRHQEALRTVAQDKPAPTPEPKKEIAAARESAMTSARKKDKSNHIQEHSQPRGKPRSR